MEAFLSGQHILIPPKKRPLPTFRTLKGFARFLGVVSFTCYVVILAMVLAANPRSLPWFYDLLAVLSVGALFVAWMMPRIGGGLIVAFSLVSLPLIPGTLEDWRGVLVGMGILLSIVGGLFIWAGWPKRNTIPLILLLALPHSGPLAYRASDLDCVRFRQTVRSGLRVEAGGKVRHEDSGREAVLVVHAADSVDFLAIEAWFDSLSVWRDSAGQRLSPDTDGMIGGRYHGRLGLQGGYDSVEDPFIPDEVSVMVQLSGAPAEVFPPLPGASLAVGKTWSDSAGWSLTRLSDSSAREGRTLVRFERYRLTGQRERRETRLAGDTLPIEMGEVETETGVFVWQEARGLLRWERHIRVDTTLPAVPGQRLAMRSRLEQNVVITRLARPASGCGPS